MVISHIIGGTGNQMFQYAAGRALSLSNDQSFLLDLNDFSNYRLHQGFTLQRIFNLRVECADQSSIKDLLGWQANRYFKKILRKPQFELLRGEKFVVEPFFNYWPDLFNLTESAYLYGYWQSERYFERFEAVIREDFIFRDRLTGLNSEIESAIRNTQSVSLHIRRGDYITHSKTASIMSLCSIEYYHEAIKYIADRIVSPVFYIFSDDIEWVKKNLPIEFPCHYVEHNRADDSHLDMHLMSICQNNIIANSSFSWWGAWLNSNSQKIVIAPKLWFRNGIDDSDLIPMTWVRL